MLQQLIHMHQCLQSAKSNLVDAVFTVDMVVSDSLYERVECIELVIQSLLTDAISVSMPF